MLEYWKAFGGGTLIGLAGILLLLGNGRILGVSGIAAGILRSEREDTRWRWLFLIGLVTGGSLLFWLMPETFRISIFRSRAALIVAGLLVGYGTQLGGGCTSGHGVCGMSRLSARSIVATLTFIFFGAVTVFVINHCLGGKL